MDKKDQLRNRARQLRKSQTPWETILWSRLRRRQICDTRFVRQYVIERYIVDFCAPTLRIVIEVDGSQHFRTPGQARDTERDARLTAADWFVLRFTNEQVSTHLEDVLEAIRLAIAERQAEPAD